MTLSEWARRHNISPEALADLRNMSIPQSPTPSGVSESVVQQRMRLEAPRNGVRLWRNNVGACVDERGNFVRYGLANESKAMNQEVKSADLIGITPVTITPQHVGDVLGVFTSIECKRAGWRYNPNSRDKAQREWAHIITTLGGFAHFATDPKDIWQ